MKNDRCFNYVDFKYSKYNEVNSMTGVYQRNDKISMEVAGESVNQYRHQYRHQNRHQNSTSE